MQWICSIALYMVLSGILLEMIADTKYYKFARWVAGVILLLQFIRPVAEAENLWNRFTATLLSFDYAMGADKILEEIYSANLTVENSVLVSYKSSISDQIGQLLYTNGLQLVGTELSVTEFGEIEKLSVTASYLDTEEPVPGIWIPTVIPVNPNRESKKNAFSPIELYIRGVLAEFYQIEENKIEVVIQEAG